MQALLTTHMPVASRQVSFVCSSVVGQPQDYRIGAHLTEGYASRPPQPVHNAMFGYPGGPVQTVASDQGLYSNR